MNIVHFSWEFPPVIFGGLGTFATEITQKQKALGNDITVFSLNDSNKHKTQDSWNGIQVYRPKNLDITSALNLCTNQELHTWGQHFQFFSDVMGYNLFSASTLVAILNSNGHKPYDIIDAHDWLGIIGGIVAKQAINKPLIFHVHSTEEGRSVGGGSDTIKEIEYEGGQQADGIITVSYAMKEELKSLGFPENKIRVCWNGIDPEKYNPHRISEQQRKQLRKSYHITDTDIMIFFIGRLVTVKGVDKLVEAMPQIIDQYPQVKLVILGIGDMEDALRSRIAELNLEKSIIIRAEFVDEQKRILHYSASDIVVLPSLYEPFGIVSTEAMAMAKPVVVGARGTSGFREQIIASGDGHCGYHVNPHDPSDIAWGIMQILQQDDQGIQMGKNGRQRAQDLFSWDAVAQRTLDIYSEFM